MKLFKITKFGDLFGFAITGEGQKCQMLKFLMHTSGFADSKHIDDRTESDALEQAHHFVSKLCAIGYLMQPVRNQNDRKAVIAIDEIKGTTGGTGKSLFCSILTCLTPSVFLDGMQCGKIEDINEIWSEMTLDKRVIYFDDLAPEFNFEILHKYLNEDWYIKNRRGTGTSITIPFTKTPKILISANCCLLDKCISNKNDLWVLQFSDFFNEERTPIDVFGNRLISEWDAEQWLLANQLVIECMQLYLEFGIVQPLLK